eukprot:1192968-Prorocentrum_minimum.AAC.2
MVCMRCTNELARPPRGLPLGDPVDASELLAADVASELRSKQAVREVYRRVRREQMTPLARMLAWHGLYLDHKSCASAPPVSNAQLRPVVRPVVRPIIPIVN